MKAPDFDYSRPRSLDEVFALLAEYGEVRRQRAMMGSGAVRA